ncbi:YybH family protein [Mangrovimonas aestuarii]|uniref:YybH family protein n=1 Tax=Mangrovimonas aestuarii TaxID=3018443 RepID=UPI002378923A|nr:nuclear transport factor 2 family protein [Mangrovimonas aestuarii]
MKLLIPFFLVVLVYLSSCKHNSDTDIKTQWINEITETEAAFAKMVKEEGINKAFLTFADNQAVLMRNNELIKGKNAIKEHLKNATSKGLVWKPDFVDVADSGDLGYTYGHYSYTHKDTLGNDVTSTGVFHTIWKRQDNGKWKFVWD